LENQCGVSREDLSLISLILRFEKTNMNELKTQTNMNTFKTNN